MGSVTTWAPDFVRVVAGVLSPAMFFAEANVSRILTEAASPSEAGDG